MKPSPRCGRGYDFDRLADGLAAVLATLHLEVACLVGFSMALGASLQALHECDVAISSTDLRAELPVIGLPALLLHGGDDATSPVAITARPSGKLMPHAELVATRVRRTTSPTPTRTASTGTF